MIERLPLRQRRAVALALAALAAALAYAALAVPLGQLHRGYDARIAALRAQLAHYRGLAQGRAEAQALLEQRRRSDASRRHYLAERTPALAAAELQRLMKRAADQGRGELISTEVATAQRSAPAAEVTLRCRVRGDIRTLQRMLHALEAGPPILFVQNLSVDLGMAMRAGKAAGNAAARDLVMSLDVSGYMRERQP